MATFCLLFCHNPLRWDKASRQRFEANQARLKMVVLAYNLLPLIRQFYVWGEEVKRSLDWLSKRLLKVGAMVSYHARRWCVHIASTFPLAHHYRACRPAALRIADWRASGRLADWSARNQGKIAFAP